MAIGKRGQNVRLASKLCVWDIEIMTRDELDEQIERAVTGFSALAGVESELAEKLVGEGFLSYDDLSVIEPDALMEMGGLSAEQAELIVKQAEDKAEEAEKVAAEQRRERREKERAEKSAGPIEAELSKEEGDGETQDGETAVAPETEAVLETDVALEAEVALQSEDEPNDAAAGLIVEQTEGSRVPSSIAEDISPTDHSGDGNHREST